jgi:hypothetical protein
MWGVAAAADGTALDASFDYLYVEANEGGSTGGHAAIRLGDDTYHFQYGADGLLQMSRDDSSDFLTEYALLRNRTIHVSRVPVSVETHAALERAFARRYLSQRAQLRRLALARETRRLVEALPVADRPEREEPAELSIRAAGFFDRDRTDSSAVLLRLRSAIERAYGPDAVEVRERRLRRRIGRAATAEILPRDAGSPQTDRLPLGSAASGLSRESLTALTALEVLGSAPSLASDWKREIPELALDDPRRERARELRDSLERELVDLFDSRRSDWGEAFLVGMARLGALQASIDAGRLIVLDAFPDDAHTLDPEGERWDEVGPELLARDRERMESAAVRVFASADYREFEYARLEAAANRFAEMRAGVDPGDPIRLARGRLRPEHTGPSAPVVLPALGEPVRRALAERARFDEKEYRRALRGLYGYNVITQNCVSAIFDTIDVALGELAGADAPEAVRAESIARLGGYVDPGASLAFIPFVSSRSVRSEYRPDETFVVPSDRNAKLAVMRRQENDLWVHLRESNVLTTTIHSRSQDDSVFFFFTEDVVATRPLYGVFNLSAGLGGSVAGLLTLPFDRGDLLLDGLKGVFASFPELFFFNIRKGSNDFVLSGGERDGRDELALR